MHADALLVPIRTLLLTVTERTATGYEKTRQFRYLFLDWFSFELVLMVHE